MSIPTLKFKALLFLAFVAAVFVIPNVIHSFVSSRGASETSDVAIQSKSANTAGALRQLADSGLPRSPRLARNDNANIVQASEGQVAIDFDYT